MLAPSLPRCERRRTNGDAVTDGEAVRRGVDAFADCDDGSGGFVAEDEGHRELVDPTALVWEREV